MGVLISKDAISNYKKDEDLLADFNVFRIDSELNDDLGEFCFDVEEDDDAFVPGELPFTPEESNDRFTCNCRVAVVD